MPGSSSNSNPSSTSSISEENNLPVATINNAPGDFVAPEQQDAPNEVALDIKDDLAIAGINNAPRTTRQKVVACAENAAFRFFPGLALNTAANMFPYGGRAAVLSFLQMVSKENLIWFETANLIGSAAFTFEATLKETIEEIRKAYNEDRLTPQLYMYILAKFLGNWTLSTAKADAVFNVFSGLAGAINIGIATGAIESLWLIFALRAGVATLSPQILNMLELFKMGKTPQGQDSLLQISMLMLILQYTGEIDEELIKLFGLTDKNTILRVEYPANVLAPSVGGPVIGGTLHAMAEPAWFLAKKAASVTSSGASNAVSLASSGASTVATAVASGVKSIWSFTTNAASSCVSFCGALSEATMTEYTPLNN